MAGDWFATVRAEDSLIAADYQRRHEEDCAAGRHRWDPRGVEHVCRTCGTRSDDPSLTDCPHQGERVQP